MSEMPMVFRTDWQSRQLLFTGWIMSTLSSYLGTLIVIFLLGVLSEYVHMQQSRLDAYVIKLLMHSHVPAAESDGESVAPSPTHSLQMPKPDTAVGEGTEVEVEHDAFMPGAERKHLDPKAADVAEASQSQRISVLSIAPWPPSLELTVKLVRTVLHLLRGFMAFMLMVTLMTLDVGLVLMVMSGSALGFFVFRAGAVSPKRSEQEVFHH
jgi:hypothetical protein